MIKRQKTLFMLLPILLMAVSGLLLLLHTQNPDSRLLFPSLAILCMAAGMFLWTKILLAGFEKRLAEQTDALRAANIEWQDTFDTFEDPVCIIDPSLKITRCNLALKNLLGLNEGEIIEKPCHLLFHHTNHPVDGCPFRMVMEDWKPHRVEIFEPSVQRWLRVLVSPIFDKDNNFKGLVHVVQDIDTERQRAETLVNAVNTAKKANEAKSRLLAVMGHEIKNIPLNGIEGMLQMLRNSGLTLTQSNYLDCIEVSVDNLMTIINSILDFARIEAGRLKIENMPFSLRSLCNDFSRVQRLRTQAKGLLFCLSIDPETPDDLVGDPQRIRQILGHLVGNAIKFTYGGEVTVHFSSERSGDRLLLTCRVRDTGIGINEKEQALIFEPFTQLEGEQLSGSGGAGLGLTICKKLATLMGGSINVISTQGLGATFTFTISLQTFTPDTETDTSQPVGNPLSVLIADDQRSSRQFLESVLRKQGYRVFSAANGNESIEIWQEKQVDIILMDIQMQDMNSLHTLGAIRAREDHKRQHTPIVALASHSVTGDRERLMEMGFDGFISKPVQTPALLLEMAKALENVHSETKFSRQRKHGGGNKLNN